MKMLRRIIERAESFGTHPFIAGQISAWFYLALTFGLVWAAKQNWAI